MRIVGLVLLVLGLPLPLIHFDMMVFYFHNWSYWAQIQIFGMLTLSAFITIDESYDKVLRFLFQQGMSISFTSVAYYFAAIYLADGRKAVGPATQFEELYNEWAPMFNIAIPSALYLVEFMVDSIYYEVDLWYHCFIAAVIGLLNVQLSYWRYQFLGEEKALSDPVSRVFDWQNPDLDVYPWGNASMFIALNAIVYFVLVAASERGKKYIP